MVKGNKPAGWGVTRDQFGREIITEFRQCSHCQTSWPYKPGSGNKVGFCMHCMGLMCSKCAKIKLTQIDKRCVPFSEGYMENSNKYFLDPNIGIFLRK